MGKKVFHIMNKYHNLSQKQLILLRKWLIGEPKETVQKKLENGGWRLRIRKEDGVKTDEKLATEGPRNMVSAWVWKGRVTRLW